MEPAGTGGGSNVAGEGSAGTDIELGGGMPEPEAVGGQVGDVDSSGGAGGAVGGEGSMAGMAGGEGSGTMAGHSGTAGAAGQANVGPLAGDGAEAGGGAPAEDPKPLFSFFTTSQEGLLTFAEDKVNGLGGDLGGLEGADNICQTLAQRANPGDQKVWRAFLSAAEAGPGGTPVHAIERIGNGPWYDYNGRLFGNNLDDIAAQPLSTGGRPIGADPQLAEMFTDENGDPVSPDPRVVDNHDMLTGSNKQGRLMIGATLRDTCNDWTSASEALPPPMIGHAWPRTPRTGRHWISDHRAGGCGRGIDTRLQAFNGTKTVGAGGGYGGFYCFAVKD